MPNSTAGADLSQKIMRYTAGTRCPSIIYASTFRSADRVSYLVPRTRERRIQHTGNDQRAQPCPNNQPWLCLARIIGCGNVDCTNFERQSAKIRDNLLMSDNKYVLHFLRLNNVYPVLLPLMLNCSADTA